MSGNDDVGVIIVAERSGVGMLGYIVNPPCRIWIQTTRRRSRSRGGREGGERATGMRRRRKKEAEEGDY